MLNDIILPDSDQMYLEEVLLDSDTIILKVVAKQNYGCCPACQINSARVHSRYQRTLADLPCVGISIRLHWTVRRFFCDNCECTRATFVEQIASVASRYSRRTNRLHHQQTGIAFMVGGEPGARLTELLEMPTSPDTLLRMIRKAPEEKRITPKILGVDDWAIRKGHTYGTILVDLETHQTIDLLTERSADVLSKWLQAHPGVEIISRDRSNEYAKGASAGAPSALQVADRFHLIKNLREALELFLEQNRHCLRAAGDVKARSKTEMTKDAEILVPTETDPVPQSGLSPTKADQRRQVVRQKRLEKYNGVIELYEQGMQIRSIARTLGLHRSTVFKYVHAGEFPEISQRRKIPTKIDPYLTYLEERWQAGCRNRLQLWREIRERGFDGTHQLVYIWTKQKGFEKKGISKQTTEPSAKAITLSARSRPWAASRAAWLLVLAKEKLRQEELFALERMIQIEPMIEIAMKLAHEFINMLRTHQAEFLLGWLRRARDSGIEALKSFVNGLENDLNAVIAAFALPWSNGPTEGSVNRLKLIKRQMYGRANFDLLRRRVLGMTPGT